MLFVQERDSLRREDGQAGGKCGVLQGLHGELHENRVMEHHALDVIRAAQEGGQCILRKQGLDIQCFIFYL